jgi:DNA-binding HxlR family transcriptional regulator
MLRTEEQRKKLCAKCPFAKTANLVGDSVVLLMLREFLSGPKRFGELETTISGVSTRTLTEKLKMLEEHSIVERKEQGGKIQYVLTKKGNGLRSVVDAMFEYGRTYLA